MIHEPAQYRAAVEGVQRRSLVVGLIASAVCAISAFTNTTQFFRAYAYVYFFLLGLPLGCLVLVMIYHLTGGVWGLLIRRIAEAQMKTLPLMAVLFVPMCFGLPYIYLWAQPGVETAEKHQVLQERYLDVSYFCWRAAGYFLIWLVLMFFLSLWSRRQDESDDVRIAWKCTQLSGPGLVIFGLTLHFAAVDWLMSLQTEFRSTIFGPLVFAGQLLSAFALSLVVYCWIFSRPEYEPVLSGKANDDLGSLFFTFLVLWSYMLWFQFMLIWIADLPGETVWYLARFRNGWSWLAVFLVLFHFVLPLFLLLLRAVKRSSRALGSVAAGILLVHLLYIYLQIMPVYSSATVWQHWVDFVMPLAMGGIWTSWFLWMLGRRPMLPVYDLNYSSALHLHETELEEEARTELAHG